MKAVDDISPWKVTERAETKQFNEENHFSLPKMSLHQTKQSQEDQRFLDPRFSSTLSLHTPYSSLQLIKSKSLGDPWKRKLQSFKKSSINSPHQKSQFRPTPPLISLKKTYKYHQLIGKNNGGYLRQSTPVIKQRIQMLLKGHELQQAQQSNCLKSLTNEQILKIQQERKVTKKTNIEFIYQIDMKLKRNQEDSPTRKAKAHILDNLLCGWQR